MPNRFLLILLLSLLCAPVFAQFKISGNVKDKDGAIAYATVRLLTAEGQPAPASAFTGDDGHFELLTAAGNYKLVITFLGYEDYTLELAVTKDTVISEIVLSEKTNTLNEAVIKSSKKRIVRKIDRLVFNIEDNPIAAGGTALDAVKVAPGIVLNNGQITMIGKSGMRVMVDGRMLQLSPEDLISFLNSIPADDIKEIEIITNPPAKYEAEGNSGIINIVFKPGRRDSWNNRISGSYTQSVLADYALRDNFTFQKNKVKILLSLNAVKGLQNVDQESNLGFTSGPWLIDVNQRFKTDDLSGRFMFDYEAGKNTKIGLQYLGSVMAPDITDVTKTRVFNTAGIFDYSLVNKGFSDRNKNNQSVNVYLEQKLDTLGRSFTIDFDYLNFNAKEDRSVNTQKFNQNDALLGTDFANNIITDQQIRNYNVKVDFEHPLPFAKFSYGAKLSFIDNVFSTVNYNTITGTPVWNPQQSNEFTYKENTQAVYVNASRALGKKTEVQLGLRLENTQTTGFSQTLNQTNKNNYLKLFPTFYITHNSNEDNAFSLSYGRRIDRPNYSRLNPARYYINSNAYSEGNPFLQPSFSDNIELSHTYKGKLSTGAFLSIETNGYNVVPGLNDATNEQTITYKNFYTAYNGGLVESYTLDKFSWWESQSSLYLLYSRSSFFSDVVAQVQNGFRFYFTTDNSFSLNKAKTLKGQVNFWYSPPYKEGLYDLSTSYSLDLALKYTFRDLTVTGGVYDVFNTSPKTFSSVVNDIKQSWISYPSNRYFRLTFSYSFGNKNISASQRSLGNEDEKSRAN